MQRKAFKGTYFEIGKQKGKIYASNGLSTGDFPPVREQVLEEQMRIYERFYPEFLEEVKGVAEGGKIDTETAQSYFLGFHVQKPHQEGCTIFGVNNNNGVLVGRNYDWRFFAKDIATVYNVEIPGKKKYVAMTDMWIPPVGKIDTKFLTFNEEDIINEDGLFMGLTYAYHPDKGVGLCNSQAIKYVAENCLNVSDALSFLRKVPLSLPKNFFIADASGYMEVFEHTSKKHSIIPPKDNVLIKTNHFLDRSLSKEERRIDWASKPEGGYYTDSFARYNRVKELISSTPNLSLNDVIKILTDRQIYANKKKTDRKTIWSLSLDLKHGKHLLYQDGRRYTLKV